MLFFLLLILYMHKHIYRRGKELCGDVDIVVSWNDVEKHKEGLFLRDIVEHLEKESQFASALFLFLQKKKIGCCGGE